MDEDGQVKDMYHVELARTRLSSDLRRVAVDHVLAHPGSELELAETLDVTTDAIEHLIRKPYWDIELTLRVLDRLHVPFRVVAD